MALAVGFLLFLPGFVHASGHARGSAAFRLAPSHFFLLAMKNIFILSLALLTGLPALAQSQNREPESAASAAQRLVEEIGLDRLAATTNLQRPVNARNLSALKQSGQYNEASIEQVSQGSSPNQALIVQAGNANIAGFYQYGTDNKASLVLQGNDNRATLQQRGSSNTYDGRVVGDQNKVDVIQDGQNNSATLEAAGNGRRYPVLQVGSNMQLTQREAAGTTAPLGYGVEMRGNGIRLTIEQGRATP